MKANHAYLSLELNVVCPNEECGEIFDLFEMENLTEDVFLYKLVVPKNGHWGCEDFEKQLDAVGVKIHCPQCKTKIEIESVEW